MANSFSNKLTACLAAGALLLGGAALIDASNKGVDFGAELREAVEIATESVQDRDVQELWFQDEFSNEHMADVDCKTGEVRFLHIGDSEWLNGAQQAQVIQEKARQNGQSELFASVFQASINNGVANVCNY